MFFINSTKLRSNYSNNQIININEILDIEKYFYFLKTQIVFLLKIFIIILKYKTQLKA